MVILTLHVSLHSVYAKTDDAFDPPISGVLLTLSNIKWTVKLEKGMLWTLTVGHQISVKQYPTP